MNQFHELNILTSRGDLRSAFLLIKSYSEGVARKIMKKAGYYVPDVKGSSFWMFVQETITNAARNRTSGYRKSIVSAPAGVRLENGNYPTLRLTDGFMAKFCLH
ncbi:hypothetical protein [Candidatus Erwinia dacicola]|uniref:Uncharacterized protein n=1 Tax=Candidatus Erwinia dacicola TaxID=252393 RepID=A0A328TNT0_9GAMM|nr:hypothetical protein [Candidatus Erwinia dacicola]RAP72289.1 hypothetical protein ACZ87_00888 [Candidatus Erwinia dacicola]RAP72302.1 hypothetical protein ACZ87_00878 [Candidatus Erwinia dacicola]